MRTTDVAIEFTLQASQPARIDVRLRRVGERWVAETAGAVQSVGIAPRPRGALAVALAPLGEVAAGVLMADLALLEPSREILELERASAG